MGKVNYTYIAIAVVVILAIVAAFFIFRKKEDSSNASNTTDTGITKGYSLGQLMNTMPNLGYTGVKQGIGESNYDFIMRRSKEGWKF